MREQVRKSHAEQPIDAPTRNRLGKIWYLIGLAWQCGDVLDENERLAIDSFRRAAGYGNTEAMRCLADIFLYRDGDLMQALDWLILANRNDVSSGKKENTESVLRSPVMLNWLNEISHAGIREIAKAIGDGFWDEATPEERRLLAEFLIARVNLYPDRLELEIKADGFSSFKDQIDSESQSETAKTEMLPNGNVLASIPFDMQITRKGKHLVLPDGEVTDKSRTAFLMAVARGRKWQRDIDEGKVRDIRELTEILQLDHSYVSRILRLAHLAPPLIEKVINDRMPENLSVARLRKGMSNNWDDQLQEFRVEA